MNYLWQHPRRFNAYSEYFKNTFGQRVQKLTINAGFTCPNRDGTVSFGGCTYCDNGAFNPSYCNPQKSIQQQIEEGISFHKNRYRRAEKYLAYFQAFSNTHAPLDRLKEVYNQALAQENIAGLVIGTRPDCIDGEKLDYFSQLSKKHYLIIEYGIESCSNQTLQLINRGHTFEQAVTALEMTAQAGIKTGAHFIFGLPTETVSDWLQWTDIISKLPLNNIKFHQLQFIKGTAMAELYQQQPQLFHRFSLEEYIDFIVDFIERLNPNIVIERFAGEVPPRFLAQPAWGLIRNDQILQAIEKKLEERNTYQGALLI
jgi:radical SAM protein (TIGR01212 family)